MTAALAALALAAAQPQGGPVIDLSKGPVSVTTVAVTVTLDAEGRVVSCRAGAGRGAGPVTSQAVACAGFRRGRVVSAPLRRNGKPTAGLMTVSTTSVVSVR